jgi:hypothetical protein
MLNGGHMTPEERLDKLTERVDAIARNVELLSGMQIKTEENFQRLEKGMTRFAWILDNHEDRIETLEGKPRQ